MQPKDDDDYEIPFHLLDEDDAPELTEEWFKNAKPAKEFFIERWGTEKAEAFLKQSREYRAQKKAMREMPFNAHVDEDILQAYQQAAGQDWQVRINDVLRQSMP
jgi:uncharacterized protein (DUF4415 family)